MSTAQPTSAYAELRASVHIYAFPDILLSLPVHDESLDWDKSSLVSLTGAIQHSSINSVLIEQRAA